MSDQAHPGAVRLQSSAMVAAALITTLGAITAACIQSGFINRMPTANVGDFSASPTTTSGGNLASAPGERLSMARELRSFYAAPAENVMWRTPHIASASFIGTVEPLNEPAAGGRQTADPPTSLNSTAPQPFLPSETFKQAPSPAFVPSAEANTAAFLPVAAADGSKAQLTAGYAPALLAEAAPVKILPSPWSFLAAGATPTAADKPIELPKAAKKSLDWSAVARLWPWHNERSN
jgi:hypothetical protein